MSNQDSQNVEKSDSQMMWVATAVIVAILVGGMGINMLIHRDTLNAPAVTGSSSSSVPQK